MTLRVQLGINGSPHAYAPQAGMSSRRIPRPIRQSGVVSGLIFQPSLTTD